MFRLTTPTTKGLFHTIQGTLLLDLIGVVIWLALAQESAMAVTNRHYYIQAEDVTWDFAPTGQNVVHHGPIPAPYETVWGKVRYIEYTDGTFTTRKPQPVWLGILGPIIRAEVGDTVFVHFRNRSTKGSFGMHPHGFRYDKDNEGAHYLPGPGAGAEIPPGGSFTYRWYADEESSPSPTDPSSLVWWYHSHISEYQETNLGLLGPIIITKRGKARPDGSPVDVDREFVTAFVIFNQAEGEERGQMHSINGYIFGNLRGLEMNEGEKVRWYLLGMGNEVDLHAAHFHGKTVLYKKGRTDTIELLPGSMATVDMNADNPGTWMYHCHVADHIKAGMLATYTIKPRTLPAITTSSKRVRGRLKAAPRNVLLPNRNVGKSNIDSLTKRKRPRSNPTRSNPT
jgi:FtsP/CotA-like multicopper oxidase with cupredoxin domain